MKTFILFCLLCVLVQASDRNHRNRNDGEKRRSNHHRNTGSEGQLREDMRNPLTDDDFNRAKDLDENKFAIKDEVLYSGSLFEGDIADNLLITNGTDGKNAIRNPGQHWPNGKVPYVISSDFDSEERAVIARAIDEYHQKTCIRFEPYSGNEPNYIRIVKGSGCSSRVGMTGGQQEVSIGDGCASVGIVEHELMHVLGFVHEQSRTDRDQHVTVNYQNIRRGLEQNFRKYSFDEVDSLGEAYDYGSVLHYGPNAFSNGNGPTIEPKRRAEIGQRRGFSEIDLNKIKKLYRCGNRRGNEGFGSGRERPDRRQTSRPEYGGFRGNRRPDVESIVRPDRESYRPDRESYSTHRPEYRPDRRPEGRPDSGYRPTDRYSTTPNYGFRPDRPGGSSRYDRYSTTPVYGLRPDRPGGSSRYDRYSTTPVYGLRPDRPGFGGSGYDRYSTRRPYEENSRYSSTPDYENGNRYPSTSSYNRFTTSRTIDRIIDRITSLEPFGENGPIGSIFGGSRRPGSSITQGGSISNLFRPNGNRLPSIIGSFFGDEGKNSTSYRNQSSRSEKSYNFD